MTTLLTAAKETMSLRVPRRNKESRKEKQKSNFLFSSIFSFLSGLF